ncbi:ABC transporter ATP-binding protein [Schumannella sp. 10F1B-5-1]|uniref:ABC transporter ATP-binding protein n=1 Tax=Schumannella sp. 10F1B-5-1 TaxID=2590780 RepID=UPI001131420C|nr:ABC transporter ATP-binding protein [Schumannella sp. 10F1B-5-1]TPW76883.1 ABC transporter ATP-binding protein [Schumannella sp. 10F1B-5-1]
MSAEPAGTTGARRAGASAADPIGTDPTGTDPNPEENDVTLAEASATASTGPEGGAVDAPGAPRLRTQGARLAYDRRVIAENLSVDIPDRSFTVIVGPNACGKSTLLRSLSRLLTPTAGTVTLDEKPLGGYAPKEAARVVGLLPQSSTAPDGITVADLVARGRYPHQGLFRQWTSTDEQAVERAMVATEVDALADRHVAELSGGQRQRVWAAMALAQETPILLLDEPTTFLDIAHQIELLDLFARLHRDGTTVVAVLHELNQAARYATHLIAMKAGEVVAEGPPSEIVTAELVEEVFGLACVVIPDPETGTPLVIPRASRD